VAAARGDAVAGVTAVEALRGYEVRVVVVATLAAMPKHHIADGVGGDFKSSG
jgi:hypothetical protein